MRNNSYLKKFISILLTAAFVLSAAGCGSSGSTVPSSDLDSVIEEIREQLENEMAKDPGASSAQAPEATPAANQQKEEIIEPEKTKAPEKSPSDDRIEKEETAEKSEAGPAEPETGTDTNTETETDDGLIHLDIPEVTGVFTLMEYYDYDDTEFMADCETLEELAQGSDAEAVLEMYEKLFEQLNLLDSLYSTAETYGNIDVTDSYWSDATAYTEEVYYDCHDAFYLAMKHAGENPDLAEALNEYFGDEEFQEILDFEETPDEIIEKELKLTELENKYNEDLNSCMDLPYSYNGRDYTLNDLYDGSINSLAYKDYNGYLQVYYGILKNVNEVLGPIFLDMLKLRADIAEYYEYDNFAEYAYAENFGRDYTTEEAQQYCDIIKNNVGSRYNDLYYSLNLSTVTYSDDTEEILDGYESILEKFDSEILEGFRFLRETGTYDIGYSEKRYEGSYTTYFSMEGVPFIFINTSNSGTGLSTLTHEFGHYLNFLIASKEENVMGDANFDIMEIQSNSMQLMCTNFYDIVYGDNAVEAETSELLDSLYQVVSGCVFDEFQRRIYEDPDITLDELNELFASVNAEYGTYEPNNYDYTWVLNPHTFLSPMYYISYSVSSLGALNMWSNSHEDFDQAVQQYKKILTYDYPGCGTIEFEEACGLTVMTDEEGITEICAKALEYISGASQGYSMDDLWSMIEDFFGENFNLDDFGFGDIDWGDLEFDFGNEPEVTDKPNAA